MARQALDGDRRWHDQAANEPQHPSGAPPLVADGGEVGDLEPTAGRGTKETRSSGPLFVAITVAMVASGQWFAI